MKTTVYLNFVLARATRGSSGSIGQDLKVRSVFEIRSGVASPMGKLKRGFEIATLVLHIHTSLLYE